MDKVLQKEIAIKCLEKLDIYKPYINSFKSKKTLPCFYENFAGFWAFSYTWNKSVEYFSEFGDVAVRAAYGGIKRIS